jgi:hypothetical protein
MFSVNIYSIVIYKHLHDVIPMYIVNVQVRIWEMNMQPYTRVRRELKAILKFLNFLGKFFWILYFYENILKKKSWPVDLWVHQYINLQCTDFQENAIFQILYSNQKNNNYIIM